MPVKHCQLDLNECINEFVSNITKIVNLSLNQGEMPHEHALVKPLLKKIFQMQCENHKLYPLLAPYANVDRQTRVSKDFNTERYKTVF